MSNLKINLNTGEFKYHNTAGYFSSGSKELAFLKILYMSPTHQATYNELCGRPEILFSNDKLNLNETIKSLKRKLNIIPKTKGSNPNIIKSVPKYGYRLEL